jgi:hypothetical protein
MRLLYPLLYIIASVGLVYFNRPNIPDDAMIYLRVAENIANGSGWSFNPGDTFNATTSSIQTIFLAFLLYIGMDGARVLWFTYAVSLSVGGVALHVALRDRHRNAAHIAPFLILIWPVVLSSIGLETAIMFALITLAVLAFEKNLKLPTGLLCGLVALTRPEGVALGMIVMTAHFLRLRKFSALIALGWGSVIAAWLLFSWTMFGTLLPHTGLVKSLQSNILWWEAGGPWLRAFAGSLPNIPLIAPLALLGAVRATRAFSSGEVFPAVFVSFGIVQVAGYSILDAPAGYWWYYAPGGISLIVAASLGLDELQRQLEGYTPNWAKTIGFAVSGIWTSIVTWGFITSLEHPLGTPYRLSGEYADAANWIRENSAEDAWVAAIEIGYVGYYSKRNVRDGLGLLHEEAIEPLKNEYWHWWFETKPEFILVHDPAWIGEPSNVAFPWPEAEQLQFETLYRAAYSTMNLIVYERRQD